MDQYSLSEKNTIKDIFYDLELSLCNEVISDRLKDVFPNRSISHGRYTETSLERGFRLGIQFVEACLIKAEARIFSTQDKRGLHVYTKSLLAEAFFAEIPLFFMLSKELSNQYIYHEYISVLTDCCDLLSSSIEGIEHSEIWFNKHINYYHPDASGCVALFNTLVELIIIKFKDSAARRRLKKRQYDIECNHSEFKKYANYLFDSVRARLVVLRIDFGYKKEFANKVTLEDAKNDLKRFHENRRHNSLFKDMIGYVVKLEYGVEKGIHFHTLLFFDGSTRDGSKYIHLAQEIGEYWAKVVTKKIGRYWNSNKNIKKFISIGQCGIGVINYYDHGLRKNLSEYVIKYLVKSEQFIRPKIGEGGKRLFKGKYPKVLEVKPGRKRSRPPLIR